jgi:hypothetical protein
LLSLQSPARTLLTALGFKHHYPQIVLAERSSLSLAAAVDDAESFYADVTLQVGAELFAAHRVVLASRSEYFGALFRAELAKRKGTWSGRPVIVLQGVEPPVMRVLLRYLYAGMSTLSLHTHCASRAILRRRR